MGTYEPVWYSVYHMYDVSAFDIWWLKPIGWLWSHFYVVIMAWCLMAYIAFLSENQLPFTLVGIVLIPGILCCWIITAIYSPVNQFRKANHLQSYFSGRHNTWKIVAPQYQSMKRSGMLTRQSYGTYGKHLVGLEVSGAVRPMAFVGVSGCITWIELKHSFPHTIIDSTRDHTSLKKNRDANGTQLQEIFLEGDFPSYFKVYQEVDRQMMTLRILTPDRMEHLVRQIGDFSIEIHDNYLRLYSTRAQKSSGHFIAFLDAIENLDAGFKVKRMNKIT